MPTPLQYHLTPLHLLAFRESVPRILHRWTQTWATGSTSGGIRLLSAVQPFSFRPFVEALYDAGRDAGQAPWLQRWRYDQAWMYAKMHETSTPHTIDHWLVAFTAGASQRETFRYAIKTAFGLPEVSEAPLPPFVSGRYREHRRMLEPLEPGFPWMAVLSGFEAEGAWGLHSWAELLFSDLPLVVCMDVRTVPREQARWSARLAYNRFVQAGRGRLKDPDMERARDAAGTAMDRLYSEALHLVTYQVLVKGAHPQALEEGCIAVQQRLSGLLKLDRLPLQGELLKYFTLTPAAKIAGPDLSWNVLSSGMAASTPWGLSKTTGRYGICWGIGATGLPVIRSLWREMLGGAGHAVMLGKTGSGKTTTIFAWLLRQFAAVDDPAQIFFADPASNGKRLCAAVGEPGARYVALGGDETINPLDIVSLNLGEQIAAVQRKLMVILGQTSGDRNHLVVTARDFTELEEAALDMALQRLYGENGERLAAMEAGRAPAPLLSDLAAALTTVVTDEGLDEVRPLARMLAFFLRTTKGRRFGAQTTIPWRFDADVISYSFENVPNNVLPIFYVVIFEGLDRYVRTRPPTAKRFIACIDEFKLMAQVPALRRYAEGATRWWRQRRGAWWSADQTVGTYLGDTGTLGSGAGHTIFANVAAKFFFNLDEADLQILEQVYSAVLSPEEIDRIRRAGEGECIAVFGTQPEWLYVALTGQEHVAFLGGTADVPPQQSTAADERADSTLEPTAHQRADRALAPVDALS